MLTPSINLVEGLLAQAYNEILQLDGYSQTVQGITIGKLVPDPDWLTPVRSRVAMLGQVGAQWLEAKPNIWGPVLTQFSDYATAFASVADMQKQGLITSQDQWIQILNDVLLAQLSKAATATTAAANALKSHYQMFSDIQPLLEQSVTAGWAALQDEEQQMISITEQLTHLQDLVDQLEDSITEADISTGKSVVTTTVKILYGIATEAGESFSFLGMATSAFTVGELYSNIINGTAEVGETLQQIAALQLEASEEAQAAAGTKMVLQLLYSLVNSFGIIVDDVMPQIATMWSNEQEKVQQAIDALNAGADPTSYFELSTMPIANANWQAISTFALAIPTMKSVIGPPVTLDPQHPIATQN